MAAKKLEFDLHYYNINPKCIKVYIFREDLTRRITWWIYLIKILKFIQNCQQYGCQDGYQKGLLQFFEFYKKNIPNLIIIFNGVLA